MSSAQYELALPPRPTDEVLKEKAHVAFLAYEAAVRSGNHDLAEAARQRFLAASAPLAKGKTRR